MTRAPLERNRLGECLRFTARLHGVQPGVIGVRDRGRCHHRTVPYNPHIKYFEGDRRGYLKATVTKKESRVGLRFVTSVEDPASTGYTERTFFVEDGHPGAVV